MASITSMMNSTSSTSSIYGTRNVLSGLASGMDTESMIENAVSGIKSKITSLLQKRTKVEWQQEAYRSIIDKAVNFNNRYTSYTSSTNLLSSSFFTNAVNTTVNGTYANLFTASGKTTSDIRINAVKQMATASAYTVSGAGTPFVDTSGSITGKEFDIGGSIPVSTVSGSLTFQYGGTNGSTFTINFDELEDLNEVEVLNSDGSVKTNATNAEKLAQAIQNKLSDVTYNYTKNGYTESTTADKAVKVSVDAGGRITFTDGLGEGNTVKISSSSGNIKSIASENVIVGNQDLTVDTDLKDYLADKTLGFTFNGSTKTIKLSDVLDKVDFTYDATEDKNTQFVNALQGEIDKAFGSGKIQVSHEDGTGLSFTTSNDGDVLSLGGSGIKALGFESGDSNYINTGKKLTDLLGDNASSIFSEANRLKGTSAAIQKTTPNGTVYYVDSAGNSVDKDGYRLDSNGKALYDFEINGAHINVTEDTTLESLINSVNSNAEAGVKISYSKLTNEFKFTSSETGSNSKIEFGGMAKELFVTHDRSASDSFAETYGLGLGEGESGRFAFKFDGSRVSLKIADTDTMEDVANKLNPIIRNKGWTASFDELSGQLMITDKTGKTVDFKLLEGDGSDDIEIERPDFGSSYTTGQDAIMDVEINGVRFEDLTRSTNSFDLDGLTVNVKGTFNEDGSNVDKDGNTLEPITFTTTTDTEKIIDAIRSFVEDYNEMATELKSAYSTQPATKTDKSRYDPLTADEESGMTESEIASYNEKAKQGLLFGDTTLSSFYSKLLNAIAPGGTDGQTLREIGIGTSYSDGMTTLSLDEDKLRTALENDPDKVKNAFTKTKEGGSSSDGLMQTLQNTLNTYVKTTGEPKGALIVKAGSTKAPTSLNSNSLLSQINSIDAQIERWQDKMSDQIDRYTTKFSRLEQLIAEMNSQASALAGLMGGNSGY